MGAAPPHNPLSCPSSSHATCVHHAMYCFMMTSKMFQVAKQSHLCRCVVQRVLQNNIRPDARPCALQGVLPIGEFHSMIQCAGALVCSKIKSDLI